jgi:hypothetical protein
VQTIHAALNKTPTPFADGVLSQSKFDCDFLVLLAIRTGQHNPSPQGECLRVLRRDANDFSSKSSFSANTNAASCRPDIAISIAIANISGTATRLYRESNVANF